MIRSCCVQLVVLRSCVPLQMMICSVLKEALIEILEFVEHCAIVVSVLPAVDDSLLDVGGHGLCFLA